MEEQESKDFKSDTLRSVELKVEETEDTNERTVKLEEEDDVPPDFFDDFSNQDFMDGLNIVDAWEENEVKPAANTTTEETSLGRNDLRNRLNKIKTEKPSSRSSKSSNMNKEKSSKDRRSKSKESGKNTRIKEGKKDSKNGHSDTSSSKHSTRRDPLKTKRDILRDKDKCAKDLETKVINEKLKVVETGLVPPGTEMDFDIKTLEEVTKKSEETVLKRGRSKSPLHGHSGKHKRRSLSKEKSRRVDRSRLHSRSPRRSRSSSLRRRSRNSRERIHPGRFIADEYSSRHSPLHRRLHNKFRDISPLSNLSEREFWLRNRYSPDRRRSRSPSYKRSRRSRSPNYRKSRRETSEEKKSFLKEIHEKLNETRPLPMQMAPMPVGPVPPVYNTMPHAPGPVPVPVPMHNQYYQPLPPVPQPQPYDQEFFIGNSPMPQPVLQPIYNMPQPMLVESPAYNIPPRPVPAPEIMPQQELCPKQPALDKETIAKLFEDKKISLSEFLSITAKSSDSSPPVDIQKTKVLYMCEGALKLLGGGNMTGRLVIRKTLREPEKSTDKFVSPLRKKPFVRFKFTSPAKNNEEKLSFGASLIKLLHSLGIPKECVNIEVTKEASPSIPSPTIEAAPPAPRINSSVANLKVKKQQDMLLGVKYMMKMVQTEPYKCPACALRNDIILMDEGTQCGNPLMLDTATQVNEEDISPQQKMMGIPRNQSLAHLTPAQILAAMNQDSTPPEEKHRAPSGEFQRERFERYSANRFDSARPPRDDRYLGDRYQANDRIQPPAFERFPENDRFSNSDRMSPRESDRFDMDDDHILPLKRFSPNEMYMRNSFDARPPERFNNPRMRHPDNMSRMNDGRNQYFEPQRQNSWMQDGRRF